MYLCMEEVESILGGFLVRGGGGSEARARKGKRSNVDFLCVL